MIIKRVTSLANSNLNIGHDWLSFVGKSRKVFCKYFVCLLVSFLLIAIAPDGKPAHAIPFNICANPGGGLPPGYQITQESVFTAYGERWFCVVTPPSYSSSGSEYPVLIVFHGGNGNPQIMMANNKGIIRGGFAANGGNGYIMVFPTGLPRAQCNFSDLPCRNNSWGDDANIGFINDVIDNITGLNFDEDRIFLAGFSGGARLIYRAIAEDDFNLPIKGITTAAGAIGLMKTDTPENGLTLVNLQAGTPVHAMIMQGEADPKMNFNGGLSDGDTELHVSFQFKVDLFRLLTGNQTAPGVIYQTPTGIDDGTLYNTGNHQVVAISNLTTDHIWPRWLSPLMFRFFDSL